MLTRQSTRVKAWQLYGESAIDRRGLQLGVKTKHRHGGISAQSDVLDCEHTRIWKPSDHGIDRIVLSGEIALLTSLAVSRVFRHFDNWIRNTLVEFFLGVFANLACAPLTILRPTTTSVNRFAIHFEPLADLNQAVFHHYWDTTIGCRANIEKEVATARYDVAQHEDQQLTSIVVIVSFDTAIAKGLTDAAILFP